MRIAYSGHFLGEGFRKLGCEVVPIRLDAKRTLDACIDEACPAPDLVFLEFFGRTELPRALHAGRHRLAVYGIDSPLNAFWLLPLAGLCDAVFVDQLASVETFSRGGVAATWLPLCVSEKDFRQPAEKAHFLTFVGRITRHRPKRANLLAHIRNHFPLNVVQGVPTATMLDVFAASRIVLNENFFPGLNLRFLHALASGSLLLTERGGQGVERHFQEGRDFVGYSPKDLLATIADIEAAPGRYEAIARQGQAACRQAHTSEHRARAVLETVALGAPRAARPVHDRKLLEARGKYYHALRFGGEFNEAVTLLKDAAGAGGELRAQALHLLGGMNLRLGKTAAGAAYLEQCRGEATPAGLGATLKLMLLHAGDESFPALLSALAAKLPGLGLAPEICAERLEALARSTDRYYDCCMLGFELLFALGQIYEPGFLKQYEERFPDYAAEFAVLAFKTRKTAEALDAIIACSRAAGIPQEALGYIKSAILAVVASEEQIAQAVTLAYADYDFAFAAIVVKMLKDMVAR